MADPANTEVASLPEIAILQLNTYCTQLHMYELVTREEARGCSPPVSLFVHPSIDLIVKAFGDGARRRALLISIRGEQDSELS
jgi:hypothetical protein